MSGGKVSGCNWAQTKNFAFPADSQIQQKMNVKKYIIIPEEILIRLAEGRYVEGSLHRDKFTGSITFNVYNRKPRLRLRDRLIRVLEHGWVKESEQRIKVYESIPKDLGTARIMSVLDREIKEASTALIDREIINNV